MDMYDIYISLTAVYHGPAEILHGTDDISLVHMSYK